MSTIFYVFFLKFFSIILLLVTNQSWWESERMPVMSEKIHIKKTTSVEKNKTEVKEVK